jgi:hypothetical protein
MDTSHSYKGWCRIEGQSRGPARYADYERAHDISGDGQPIIQGSSDPVVLLINRRRGPLRVARVSRHGA